MDSRSKPTCLGLSAAALGLVLSLGACREKAQPPAQPAAQSEQAKLPAALQATYDRSCKTCHSSPASGAPQAGDMAAWAPLVKQGLETLLDHTINGSKSMPPLGACMDCTEKELVPLIEYMAATKLAN